MSPQQAMEDKTEYKSLLVKIPYMKYEVFYTLVKTRYM
jgi:hypothetical protein